MSGCTVLSIVNMESLRDGWFTEVCRLWPHQRFSFRIKEILHLETSKYQEILIVDSVSLGRVLILDGIIQCTEFDEFAYQEMISFLPLNCHKSPKRVLIVGGGDGGVAREVVKHSLVEEVIQVEIDKRVVELSKQFLPFMSSGFTSSKLELLIGNGIDYMRNCINEFDVIITDSSDPIGPAECLFTTEYLLLLKSSLKRNGIICSQAGNPFTCSSQVRHLLDCARDVFNNVSFAYTCVPTYPNGQIGFLLATDDTSVIFNQPDNTSLDNIADDPSLRYYSVNIHSASFKLPRFIEHALNL